MVRAVVAAAYGGPEVIEVVDVESREPGPGEVTIAVRAAALNRWDAKQAAGAAGTDPAKLPMRLGSEAAGVVTAVGADAVSLEGETLAVGDEVYGHKLRGAQASELTVKAGLLVRKPPQRSFVEAAGLLANGTTAVHALEAVGVGEGDVVLLHSASGAVGWLVAQLARLRGARVIGTASERNHDALRELGVEPVVYGDGLLERVRALAPEGVDAAIDTVGTDEAVAVSLALLAHPERLVTIANAQFDAVTAAGGKAIGGGAGADPGSELRDAARLELAQLFAAGAIGVDVARAYPLEEARAAYEHLVTGHAGGKVVLEP
jgi:NADPH:quinone reductase and related Zn-dependent oxidoreductases